MTGVQTCALPIYRYFLTGGVATEANYGDHGWDRVYFVGYKLGNSEMRTLVNAIVTEKLETYLEENPAVGRAILDKALTANRAREAARKARESIRRKTALGGAAMPDKLRDCNEANPELTEIYIVEGDSAGGSATQGRDSRFQAILPLWGKMLNVEKARADKVYGNDKLTPVITALGVLSCRFIEKPVEVP